MKDPVDETKKIIQKNLDKLIKANESLVTEIHQIAHRLSELSQKISA